MNRFDPGAMLSFDLETTSANPLEARIVTSALVTISGGTSQAYEMLADPGVEIPEQASEVHGITTEYAREHGRDHESVLRETIEKIYAGWEAGLTLIVFNAAYDLTVLRKLSGDFVVEGPVVDPFVIDKALDPYRKGRRNLSSMCEHYGVRIDNAHEATADALASARIAWKQAKCFPQELVGVDSDDLMTNQAVWHQQSVTKLQQYFASKGQDTTNFDTGWPLHSALT
ncbi:3'-5' exonuclease [Corynebacterium choanae]|nr:3'-5' exonuclease [Corynebacterium choanae]